MGPLLDSSRPLRLVPLRIRVPKLNRGLVWVGLGLLEILVAPFISSPVNYYLAEEYFGSQVKLLSGLGRSLVTNIMSQGLEVSNSLELLWVLFWQGRTSIGGSHRLYYSVLTYTPPPGNAIQRSTYHVIIDSVIQRMSSRVFAPVSRLSYVDSIRSLFGRQGLG